MRIVDMINSPGFNPSTNSGRGEWSLRDVSFEDVFLDDWWQKPECIDHGAMNLVNEERTIWRCLNCGRACYDMDQHDTNIGNPPVRPFDVWSEGYADNGGRSGAIYLGTFQATSFDDAVEECKKHSSNPSLFRKTDEKWYFWGCQLFNNASDASKSFG